MSILALICVNQGALRNDFMVAVKKLRIISPSQEDLAEKQFLVELKFLKTVKKHKNIVRFLGYCAYRNRLVMEVEGEDRLVDEPAGMFLCFEYAPNGNVHDYLQGICYITPSQHN